MDASDVKTAQLPLDFSLNVKSEAITNLNIRVKSNGDSAPTANMLISPDKNSQSAFKVVTPKQNTDGMCSTFRSTACNRDSFYVHERFPYIIFSIFVFSPTMGINALTLVPSIVEQCHFHHS